MLLCREFHDLSPTGSFERMTENVLHDDTSTETWRIHLACTVLLKCTVAAEEVDLQSSLG